MANKYHGRLNSQLATLFCVFAVLICTAAGALFAVNTVLKKDHLAEIIVQYYAKDGSERVKNAYSLLDEGDPAVLKEALADGSVAAALASLPGLEEFERLSEGSSVFDSLQNYGGLFSGVSSLVKVINGDYTVVSVALRAAEASSLVTSEAVLRAMDEAGIPVPDPAFLAAGINAFLHTRLAAGLTASLAYRYYDELAGRGNDAGALYEELYSAVVSRPRDVLLLCSGAGAELDAETNRRFAASLAQTLMTFSPPPGSKTVSPGVKTLLGMVFSYKMAFVWLFLGSLNIAVVWLLLRDGSAAVSRWGVSFIICGVATAALGLLKRRIIGEFFTSSRYFALDHAFFIVGGLFALFGIALCAGAAAYDGSGRRSAPPKTYTQSNVLTASEVEIISRFGLSDLVMSNEVEKMRRPDGTVDYYGDGRGLEAQREFLRKQKEREEAKKKAASELLRGITPGKPSGEGGITLDGTTLNGEIVTPENGGEQARK